MIARFDPHVRAVYQRLWHYVVPYWVMGLGAIAAMALAAGVEAN